MNRSRSIRDAGSPPGNCTSARPTTARVASLTSIPRAWRKRSTKTSCWSAVTWRRPFGPGKGMIVAGAIACRCTRSGRAPQELRIHGAVDALLEYGHVERGGPAVGEGRNDHSRIAAAYVIAAGREVLLDE